MNRIKYILYVLSGPIFLSCEYQNLDSSTTHSDHSKNIKAIKIDSFYIDKNKVNSNKWREYKGQSIQNDKPHIYVLNTETTLNELIKLSSTQKKVPILYFHANWCNPCLAFKKSLQNQQVINVFENVLLIGVDIDFDPHNLAEKYSVRSIPTFIKFDHNSIEIARITSAEWDDDTPQNIAPIMDKLINQTFYHNNLK